MSLSTAFRSAPVVLLLASSFGCAALSGQGRATAVKAQLDAYRFQKPIDEVWPVAIRMLANKGWEPIGKDRELIGMAKDGAWSKILKGYETRTYGDGTRELQTKEDPTWLRYHLEGADKGNGTCEVRISSLQRHAEPSKGEDKWRDLQLELELVEMIDAEAAAKIVDNTRK